jgi:hypothetical protein
MGSGRWNGQGKDKKGIGGDIRNLTIDGDGNIEFDYDYTHGGQCTDGHFKGRIVNDYLDGSWTETYDGKEYTGESKIMRRIRPTAFGDGFSGSYRVTSHVPGKDDSGFWTIEFDV